MTRFRCRAVNAAGDLIEGEMDGQDQTAVVDQLRRQGHLLLATEPVVAGVEDVGSTVQRWLSQPLFGHGKVGRREVAMITRQLATMLDAGLTIDQTLRFLVDLADSELLRAREYAADPEEGRLMDKNSLESKCLWFTCNGKREA